MTTSSLSHSPQRMTRIAGIFYLAIILLGLFGETLVRGTLVHSGDPAATANSIAASPLLWRAGLTGDLLMQLFDLPMIVVLYLLLKPINKPLALLATAFNLIQTAVLAANKLNLLIPLFLLNPPAWLQSFSTEQLHALSYLAIKAHGYGFAIGLIFFGAACLVRGWLIIKSAYFPAFLGWLIVLAGLSYLVNSLALLMAPALANLLFPAILIPPLVGELTMCLWMIFVGVNLQRWPQPRS